MYTQSILILAEAALADNDLNGAKSLLKTLLTLVRNHPMATDINDQLEGRYNGGIKNILTVRNTGWLNLRRMNSEADLCSTVRHLI